MRWNRLDEEKPENGWLCLIYGINALGTSKYFIAEWDAPHKMFWCHYLLGDWIYPEASKITHWLFLEEPHQMSKESVSVSSQ